MQQIQLEIQDNNFEIVLNILSNLKDGLIKNMTVQNSDKKDSFLKEMEISKSDIQNGKVSDFNFDDFVKDLNV